MDETLWYLGWFNRLRFSFWSLLCGGNASITIDCLCVCAFIFWAFARIRLTVFCSRPFSLFYNTKRRNRKKNVPTTVCANASKNLNSTMSWCVTNLNFLSHWRFGHVISTKTTTDKLHPNKLIIETENDVDGCFFTCYYKHFLFSSFYYGGGGDFPIRSWTFQCLWRWKPL